MAFSYFDLAVFLAIAHILYRTTTDKLKQYPGPFLARWTKAWRFLDCITGWHKKRTLVKLHSQHGDVVRIGPNVLSFAHPQAVRDTYGTDKHFAKSDYYVVAAAVARGRPNPSLFSSTDTAWHDNLRRAIQPAFNLTTLIQYEPFVNNTVATFIQQLDKRFADKSTNEGIVDLSY